FFTVPQPLIRAAHTLVRSDWLDPDTQDMLAQSRWADPAPFAQLLGRAPLAPAQFIADGARWRRDAWLLPGLTALRWSLALLWIVTGIVSLCVYPVDASLDLLARSGFGGPLGLPLLVLAATLDIALGFAILWLRRGRRLL